MGIDALHFPVAMARGIAKEAEHLVLAVRRFVVHEVETRNNVLLNPARRTGDWTSGAGRGKQSLQCPARRIGRAGILRRSHAR